MSQFLQAVVFVDSGVRDHQHLIAGLRPDVAVRTIPAEVDGVEYITTYLQNQRTDVVHLVTHGAPGSLKLGTTILGLHTLHHYSNQLQSWFTQSTSPSLLLYGCHVAAGDAGAEFIARLTKLTQSTISASARLVGPDHLEGSWHLDGTPWPVNTSQLAFQAEVLATYTGTLAIDVNSPTSGGSTEWVAIPAAGANAFDFAQDQQTGSTESDLVGDPDNPMFYYAYDDGGTVGDLSDDTLGFRIRVGDDSDAAGFKGALFIGLDADLDGAVDIFVGVDNSGSGDKIAIWDTGSDLNISPSTTSITVPASQTTYTVVEGTNYSFIPVDNTSDPGNTSDPDGDGTFDLNGDADNDYFLTFTIPLNDLITNLDTLAGITGVDTSTPIAYILGTATQDNSLNQDIGGVDGGTSSTSTFESLGAISTITQLDGTAVNDAPVNNIPLIPQATDQDVALVFSTANSNAIQVSDPDVSDADPGPGELVVTLTATNGTLTLSQTTGLNLTDGTGTDDITLTFSGTPTDINAALDGLTFTPDLGYQGEATITIVTDDQGNTGTGGAKSDTDVLTFQVNDPTFNDAPINTVPETQIISQSTNVSPSQLVISEVSGNPIGVTDSDAGNGIISVTLQITTKVGNGDSLSFGTTDGLTTFSGDGTDTLTMTGTVAAINNALDGLVYNPNNNSTGTATITMTTDDGGNTGTGGALTDVDTFQIIVDDPGSNDAPVNGIPPAQTLGSSDVLVFSTANTNEITVRDPDIGVGTLTVTLTAANGTLTLGNNTEVSITGGAEGTSTLTFTGTQTEVNTALEGLTFTPTGVGAGSLQIDSSDGSLSDSDSFGITVVPTVTLGVDKTSINEDGTTTITLTATADGPVSGAQTVNLSLSGTASAADFQESIPASLTIADGTTTADVTLTVATDALVEGDETAVFTILNPSSGVALGSTVSQSITILDADTTNPTLVSTTPVDDATGVAVGDNLTLTFDENVQFGTGNITLYRASDDSVVEAFDVTSSGQLSVSGATVTIDPTTDLDSNETYYVQVDATAITDTSSNPYAGISDNATFNFATELGGTVTTFSNTDGITTPDLGAASPYPSEITVTGLTGVITDLNVTLNVGFVGSPSDLDILLVHEDSDGNFIDSLVLMSDVGGVDTTASIVINIDDEAAGSLPTTALAFGATIDGQPTNYDSQESGDGVSTDTYAFSGENPTVTGATDLSTFDGEDPNGVWKLYIVDDEENGTATITSWSLDITTLEVDATAPTVTTFSPADNSADVAVGTNISITFDEDIQLGTSGLIRIFDASDNTAVATFDVATGTGITVVGDTITLDPSVDLADDSNFYVQVDVGAIEDLAGNAYAGISDTTTFNFSTVDNTAPTIDTFNPLDGATGVATDTNLVITFSEAIALGGSGFIRIFNADGDVEVASFDVSAGTGLTVDGATLTINPSVDLVGGEDYYVQITGSAIVDQSGNAFAGIGDTTTFNFTVDTAPTGTITIDGTTEVGETLTVNTSGFNDADGISGGFSFQWQVSFNGGSSWTNIDGETGNTLTVGAGQAGGTIRVVVTYTDDGGANNTVESGATGAITTPNSPATGTVTIDGGNAEGNTLTANTGGINDADGISGGFSFQWQISADGTNWSNIDGATNATFVPDDAEVGNQIRVIVSFTDDGGNAESLTSAGTAAITNTNDSPTGSIIVTGDAEVGSTLNSSNTIADEDGLGAFSFQWQFSSNGGGTWTDISGATNSSYTLTASEDGGIVRLVISFTDGGGNLETINSDPTGAVSTPNSPATGTVTIDGGNTEGNTLTANTGGINDADGISGGFSFQWQISTDGTNWSNIDGATNATFVPDDAEVGNQIRVIVSFTDDGGNAESLTSAGTAAITNTNDSPTGSITITGTTEVGSTLTSSNTITDEDGISGSFSFQWQASADGGSSWTDIAGANSDSYTLTASEEGDLVRLVITYTDDGSTLETVESSPTAAITIPNTGPTTLFGNALAIPSEGQVGIYPVSLDLSSFGIPGTITDVTITLQGLSHTNPDDLDILLVGPGGIEVMLMSDTGGSNTINGVDLTFTTGGGALPDDTQITTGTYSPTDQEASNDEIPSVTGPYTGTLADFVGGDPNGTWQLYINDDLASNSGLIEGFTLDITTTSTTFNGIVTFESQTAFSTININEDSSFTFASNQGNAITVSDPDVGDTITVTLTGTNGIITLGTTSGVTVSGDGDGSANVVIEGSLAAINTALDGLTFTPTANFSGAASLGIATSDGDASDTDTINFSVAAQNDPATGSVTISGGTAEGNTLTAETGTIADIDGLGTFSYQWEFSSDGGSSWSAIGGATGSTFVPDDAQVGGLIRVVVSFTDGGGSPESFTSSATGTITNTNDNPTGSISITGATEVGSTLNSSNTIADEDGLGTFSFQWQFSSNGGGTWTDISGATNSSYTLTAAEDGGIVRLVISFTDGGGNLETIESDPTGSVSTPNAAPTGNVVITGGNAEGNTLTADTSGILDGDGISGGFSYQWQISTDGGSTWLNLGGETNSTFVPDDSEVGNLIRVQVSYTDDGGNNESLTSAATAAITNTNDAPAFVSFTVDESNGLAEGQVLGVSLIDLTDADGLANPLTLSFQWQVSDNGTDGWTDIDGATNPGFISDDSEVGKFLRIEVSYTDEQGTVETIFSDPTSGPITNVNDNPTGSISITGDAEVGSTLTSSNTITDEDGISGSFSFQWQVSFNGGTDWNNISGATSDSYTLTASEDGGIVRLVITYTDDGSTLETVESGPTGAVSTPNAAPTGNVVITGGNAEGNTLTADISGINDADGLGTFSYQWQISTDGGTTWLNLSGETNSTFVPDDSEVGDNIRVIVSYTDGLGNLESLTSSATDAITNTNDAPAFTSFTVDESNGLAEGQTLGISLIGLTDEDGLTNPPNGFSIQWQVSDNGTDGWTDIDGATNPGFISDDSEVGKFLRIEVTYTDEQGTVETIFSDPTSGPITNTNDNPTGSISITGTTEVGSTLNSSNTIADEDGLGAFSFQWQFSSNGGGTWTDISGATNSSYTLTAAEDGGIVRLVISFTDGGGNLETINSDPTGSITTPNTPATGEVTITGGTAEGDTLTADTSAIEDVDGITGDPFTYQWQVQAGGTGAWVNIDGATNSTFEPDDAEVGDSIRVVVNFTDDGGNAESFTSTGTPLITETNDLPTFTSFTIDAFGGLVEGQELAGDLVDLADEDGIPGDVSFTLQWQSSANGTDGWTDIDGATTNTFVPDDSEVGLFLRLSATFTDEKGTVETIFSDPTSGVITNVNDAPTGSVTITGTPVEDGTLTADISTLADEDGLGTFSYQWQVDDGAGGWNDIAGATNASFTPGDDEVGESVRVVVSYTDGGGANESVPSAGTPPITNLNDLPTGSVTIDGTLQEDATLTANISALVDDDGLGTFSYQWQVDDGAGGWNDIAGATNATFTPGDDEVGDSIRVVVSYTDGEGTDESVESAGTTPITNLNDSPTGGVTIDGTAEEDTTLTANTSVLVDNDGLGTFSYQWQVSFNGGTDWSNIGGATGDTFTPGDAEVGGTIRVVVSYTDDEGTNEAVNSTPTTTIANVNDSPTGEVTVNGDAEEGATLTANTTALVDNDGISGGFSYQWQFSTNGTDWSDIDGATNATFTPDDAQVGGTIRVVVSYTDDGGANESVNSTPTGTITNLNDGPTGSVTVDGTAEEGATLTANTSALVDPDGISGSFSYQWQVSLNGGFSWNTIAGATEATFIPDDAQVNGIVRVLVTYTDDGGANESVTSTPTTTIANVNDLPTGDVTIGGTVLEGEILTANPSGLADEDGLGSFSYQWQIDDGAGGWDDIVGATNITFTPDDAQVGESIRVVVSYTDGEGTDESVASAGTIAVPNVNDDPTGSVTIDGTAEEDTTLTANTDTLADEDGLGTFSYQWQVDDGAGGWDDITGATNATFTPGDDEVGDSIRVVVSYTDGEGANESVTSSGSSPIANVNDTPTGSVTIDGNTEEGATLTANTDALSDDDGLGTFSYQWQVDDGAGGWDDITGATNATFVPNDAEVDDNIRVVVSYTDGEGTNESVESTDIGPITNVNDLPTGSVTIDGDAEEDATLTANTDTLADEDGLGTFSYQWQVDDGAGGWDDITGATSATFTPGDDEVGESIRVVVSYTDGEGTNESVESTGTTPIANVNDTPTGSVTIDGDAEEGATLTANTDALSDDDGLGAFSYQWQVDDGAGGWLDIDGANASIFTPDDGQVGSTVRVVVSYTDGEGTNESVESTPSSTITNVNDTPTGSVAITGDTQEGATLTANTSGLGDADGLGTFSYQWQQSDGAGGWLDIDGATDGTFVPDDDQVGDNLRVIVSYTDGGGTPEEVISEITGAISNVNDLPTGDVTIDGDEDEGATLTANISGLEDEDGLGSFSYQWQVQAGGTGVWTNIDGATNATFTPDDNEVGDAIRVLVSYTDGGGTGELVTSIPTGIIANVNDTPTGGVTITGSVAQNSTLTADTSTLDDDDGLGVLSYQWQISTDGGTSWSNIGGAVGSTFTPTNEEVDDLVRVIVSYTDGEGTPESVTSPQVGPIADVNDPPVGNVPITGLLQEDATLTADTSGLSDADGLGTFSYQWQISANGVNGWAAIDGATAATFTPGDDEVGNFLRVVVTYTDGNGNAETVTGLSTPQPIANVNDTPTGGVTVTGIPTEDEVLTVNTDSLVDNDGLGTFSYQWQVSFDSGSTWTDIAGADGTSITLGDDEVGGIVRVVVSYTDGNGTAEVVNSTPTSEISNINDPVTGSVTITGILNEGETLLVNTDGLGDADGLGDFSYQWQVSDGAGGWLNINGATEASFVPNDAEVGDNLRVVVTYTDGNGTSEEVISGGEGPINNVNDLPTGEVVIDGDAVEDGTLTANIAGIDDEDGLTSASFSYQWQVLPDGGNWTDIDGATAATLVLGDDEVGQRVRVVLTYTDDQGATETVISDGTDPIANLNDLPDDSGLTITGTLEEGQTLTVDTTTLTDDDGLGVLSYQWQRSNDGGTTWVDIADATATSFIPGNAEAAQILRVQITYTDGNGTEEEVFTPATGTIAVTNVAPVIDDQTYDLGENSGTGTIVATLIATDADNDGLTYEIISGNDQGTFILDETTGELRVANRALLPDFETESDALQFSLTVRVTDDSVEDSLSDEATITVNIVDVNEHSDFNDDASSDIVWRDPSTGLAYVWYLDNGELISGAQIFPAQADPGWQIEGVGDFDGDGREDDLVWRNYETGSNYIWFTENDALSQVTVGSTPVLSLAPDSGWLLRGVGDFDGDLYQDDLVWYRPESESVFIWFLDDGIVVDGVFSSESAQIGDGWDIAGVTSYDADGIQDDILWQNSITGEIAIWTTENGFATGFVSVTVLDTPEWQIVGVSDYDGDLNPDDILWQNTNTGAALIWNMNGTTVESFTSIGTVSTDYTLVV